MTSFLFGPARMLGLLGGALLLTATPAAAQRGQPAEDTPVRAPPGSLAKRIAAQQKQAVIDAEQAAKAEAAAIADPSNTLNLDLSTGGRVVVQLRPDKAPNSVERIKTLTRRHFYDGLTFHRVIEGFMAQGGDPKGDGSGGSDLPDVKAEFNDMPHVRGVMSMARAESKDSANSQFFIMLAPLLTLDGKYSPIGRVVSGMAYVDAIERGEPPANPARIVHATLGSDNAPPPATAPAASGAAAAAADAATLQASDAKQAANEA
ncbi:MAG: peptidylprolyl isomerase, partial [Sphingomonas sp.]